MLRFAAVLALTGAAVAAAPATMATEPAVPPSVTAQVEQMDGYMQATIVAVNSDRIRLKPMSGGSEVTVKVSNRAMIEVNGRMGTVDDLNVGHIANVMTEREDGEVVATMIQARTQM